MNQDGVIDEEHIGDALVEQLVGGAHVEPIYNKPPEGFRETLTWLARGNENVPTTIMDRLSGRDKESALWFANKRSPEILPIGAIAKAVSDKIKWCCENPGIAGFYAFATGATVFGVCLALNEPSRDEVLSTDGGPCEESLDLARISCEEDDDVCGSVKTYRDCLSGNGIQNEEDMPTVLCTDSGQFVVHYSDDLMDVAVAKPCPWVKNHWKIN